MRFNAGDRELIEAGIDLAQVARLAGYSATETIQMIERLERGDSAMSRLEAIREAKRIMARGSKE